MDFKVVRKEKVMKLFKSVIVKMMIVILAVGGLAVAKADTAAAASLTTKGSVWVKGSNVNVREKPDIKSKSLGKVNTGTELGLYEKRSDGWSCIDYKGSAAYIKTEFLSDKKVAPVAAAGSTKKSKGGSKKSSNTGAAATAVAATATAAAAPAAGTYILNKNSKKFHNPGCSSVSDMSEKNKIVFNGTRDEVIAQGYVPCKRCKP